MGQTWQNVTASRSAGVTYTNNTGKPITVAVMSNTSAFARVLIYQNGIGTVLSSFEKASGTTGTSLLIPNGVTYKVAVLPSVSRWQELR